jgi:hypothetical protein
MSLAAARLPWSFCRSSDGASLSELVKRFPSSDCWVGNPTCDHPHVDTRVNGWEQPGEHARTETRFERF